LNRFANASTPTRLAVRVCRQELMLQRLAEDLRNHGKIDLSEAFVDATFAGAKKGVLLSYPPWEREQDHGDLRPP
jgi:hypothetical protein